MVAICREKHLIAGVSGLSLYSKASLALLISTVPTVVSLGIFANLGDVSRMCY